MLSVDSPLLVNTIHYVAELHKTSMIFFVEHKQQVCN